MDEQIKQPLLLGVVVANVVFVTFQFIFNWGPKFSYGGAMIGLLLGLAVGGGVFAAVYFLQRD